MSNLKVDIQYVLPFISEGKINDYEKTVLSSLDTLMQGTGKGNDFLGWLNLPGKITDKELTEIEETAQFLRQETEVVVVIGIGGSYLGAKAVIEALSHSFSHMQNTIKPLVIFAGHNICEDYYHELFEILNKKSYGIIVISKSGTTTEPAIAFRLLKSHLESKIGKAKAKERIIAITDATKGALRTFSEKEGYKTFIIPDDVGGRYSVLTPVGLLPIAVAGFNIKDLISGAKHMQENSNARTLKDNPVLMYAALRNLLYAMGKQTEILVSYDHKLQYIAEWWKQLYGESEGKENKGIFPASVGFTTDLHSMGQYIQEGLRNIFETVISVRNTYYKIIIPDDEFNLDQLNYLTGKRISEVNSKAELGTIMAHNEGKVPNIRIEIEKIDAFSLGQMFYFFEKACGVSGYLLGINPFDQPGVEAYKKNMFALLGK